MNFTRWISLKFVWVIPRTLLGKGKLCGSKYMKWGDVWIFKPAAGLSWKSPVLLTRQAVSVGKASERALCQHVKLLHGFWLRCICSCLSQQRLLISKRDRRLAVSNWLLWAVTPRDEISWTVLVPGAIAHFAFTQTLHPRTCLTPSSYFAEVRVNYH